ncbi:GroES-like protein [Apiospora phragmitis]|uniref:GroES-like protein n=1 Tax=Apiospora phragmitis TaxID=2905665 RepID=A0ABR1W6C9_9PEZI
MATTTTTTSTTPTKNMAAWLTAPKARPFTVAEAPMPAPGPDEVVVRVHAVALNPVDWFIQAVGIIVPADTGYPAVIGCDLAGEVVAVGANSVSSSSSGPASFAPGDRVCGLAGGREAGDFRTGAFQLYAKADRGLSAKIPDAVSYAQAAVLPLGLSTAATALFQKDALALPLPGSSSPSPSSSSSSFDKDDQKKKVLLVWGGRTSVGSCAIQLAAAAGLDVATTASARNHAYCRGLGATWVFDYHNDAAAVEDEICVGVLDAWSRGSIVQCARVVLKLDESGGGGTRTRKWVQTVLPSPEQVGEEVPEGVEVGYTYGTTLVHNEVGPAIWGKWVPEALASGALQCKPDPEVVAQDLEGIQAACDIGAEGWGTSSSPKLVVEFISE